MVAYRTYGLATAVYRLGPGGVSPRLGRGGGSLLLSAAGGKRLIITPPDLEGFRQAFRDVTRMGSLEVVPELSERPDFLGAGLWGDPAAGWLILPGPRGPWSERSPTFCGDAGC